MEKSYNNKPKRMDGEGPEWPKQAHADVRMEGAGAIAAGSVALQKVLDLLVSGFSATGDRAAAVGIDNFTSETLANPQRYIYSGQVVSPQTTSIAAGYTGDCAFTKTSGAARGSVGVVTWDIGATGFKLAVFWSNPYDYISASQLIWVDVVSTSIATDYNLYSTMWSASGYATDQINRTANGYSLTLGSGTTTQMEMRAGIRNL